MTRDEMNEALDATEEELDAIAAEYENDTWDETTLISPPSSTTFEDYLKTALQDPMFRAEWEAQAPDRKEMLRQIETEEEQP